MIERTYGNWTLRGRSIGGFGTSFQIKELGVSLDVGFFLPELLKGDHLFLSHGHPDHVGALVSWLGARRLMGMHTANIFVVNPFEGTGLADWAREIGKPVLSEFERNYFSKEFVNLTEVPDDELNRIRRRTVRAFFLNPRRANRVLRDLPDKDNLWPLIVLLMRRLMLKSTG